ncbi:pentatricopeptide repeat-containing protein, chloroplastic [Salvia divinorum]|uniref:Pentatricopeptide repeat-containing protein, chloroplastic n=1 Tax=Salvia divinorum TaxID=28513 RepID=A0ABD1HVM9_SALDI
MPACFCSFNQPSTSISTFISNHPHLSMLETTCRTITDLKKIHAHLIKTGLSTHTIAASRLLAFSAARDLHYALSIFRRIPKPNPFTWNTIIRGFSQSSDPNFALLLFFEMLNCSEILPEHHTYPSVFKAYTQLGLPRDGAQLHGRIVKQGLESDPFIRNSIIHMYANCGFLENAWKLFDESRERDVVAWNSMIMGLARCGEIEESWRLFCKIPFRNEISWNTMISGFVRNGRWIEAFDLFHEMQSEQIRPTEFTLVSMLNACGKLGALEQGKWIHDYIKRNDLEMNVIVATAIIDMYCKCGDVKSARLAFKNTPRKGLSCWNSMMLGLATNGCYEEVFAMFNELESSNLRPDGVSIIAVLTASSHSLRVDEARRYFRLLTEEYRMEAKIEHYGCMVDTLGRAGMVEEAAEFVASMPMEPDVVVWGSLLAACRNHGGRVEVAEWAARNLRLLDGTETSAHVLMANVYAGSGDFEKAVEERREMERKEMEKEPGCSLIEVNGEVHEFVAGGNWHYRM